MSGSLSIFRVRSNANKSIPELFAWYPPALVRKKQSIWAPSTGIFVAAANALVIE